ncbi:MAG TPA: FtsH protease activity modulator HflK, partial [Anaerolineae bacterium]|nr:FtsH protease activity modulator HflK [Anaerolineae bacterium]
VNAAKAYAAEKVNAATGEAARFTAQQVAHADTPAITHIRLYLEAVENILPGVRKVLVDPSVTLQTTDLWFAGDSTLATFPPKP